MGPGASGNISNANNISGTQVGVASQAQTNASNDYSQYKSLLAPLIQQQTKLASGDRSEALAAAMPVISKLSGGFTGAKQGIMNTVAPGAARDTALANLETSKDTGIAGAQAGAVAAAPGTLAGIGKDVGTMSLQEFGAALAGLQGGAQTNQGAGNMAAAQQQAMLQFFTSLASTGGGVLGASKWITG